MNLGFEELSITFEGVRLLLDGSFHHFPKAVRNCKAEVLRSALSSTQDTLPLIENGQNKYRTVALRDFETYLQSLEFRKNCSS